MPRAKDTAVRRLFRATLAETRDYREAARVAGVSDRTGRRWRQEITAGEATTGTREAFAAQKLPPLRPSATSFEGRSDDLLQLHNHFERGERLVTLFGPPGIGKTRLAKEWAHQSPSPLSARMPSVFCDLRGIGTAEAFVSILGKALALAFEDDARDQVEILASALAARGPCLLVLDNFEELIDEGTTVLTLLLRRAEEARFLITSRRMLKLRQQVVCELAPLSLPRSVHSASDSAWTESDAMRLFWARAHAAEPGLGRGALPPATVAALVRRLDGIPLAIEISAAQLTRVGVKQLLDELNATLLSMEQEAVDTDPRHRTLKAALEHSYRPLSPTQKGVLSQLSVFRNGFTKRAALSVVGGVVGEKEAEAALAALRERSLLRLEAHPSGEKR